MFQRSPLAVGRREPCEVVILSCVFFFQAEDGIRDSSVTGVQTCALPIYPVSNERRCRVKERAVNKRKRSRHSIWSWRDTAYQCTGCIWKSPLEPHWLPWKIGRASCRERV